MFVSNGTSSTTITRIVTVGSSSGALGDTCSAMVPDQNVYITFHGDSCNLLTCSANANVVFAVSPNGYDFTCAQHTYAWDFGDGGHSTDTAPSHKYTADGTYRVTVHVVHGTTAVDLTSTVQVVGAPPPPPTTNRRNRGH
jgi:hypothetical protein